MRPLPLRTWITNARTAVTHPRQTKASLKGLWIHIQSSSKSKAIVATTHSRDYQQTFSCSTSDDPRVVHRVWSRGPQPFWHRRPASWKTIFPRMGRGWSWGEMAQALMRAMGSDREGSWSFAHSPARSPPAVWPGSEWAADQYQSAAWRVGTPGLIWWITFK